MQSYLPHTKEDIASMLSTIGVNCLEDLFEDIPESIRLNKRLQLHSPMSELEVSKKMKELSGRNLGVEDLVCFLGAGAYDHYIPSIIHHLTSRSEFYTAYTPYQPEISQGTLQVIFEYQSMMCELTGMDVSNASLYDGATAAAEGAFMACASTRRDKIAVSKTVNPQVRKVLKTYMAYKDIELIEIEEAHGVTDIQDLRTKMNKEVAGVIIQSPNFFGIIEDVTEVETITHDVKGLLMLHVDPISLAILKSPGDCGADIVVGEGQGLGNPLNYGGPYLGFIACTKKLMRKLPGRIVGETEDIEGKRGFVLTLQAREQHIRREKATSNITSNQALNALAAAIYLTTLGKEGLKEVANLCLQKAHYAAKKITALDGYKLQFDQPFFKEFVVTSDTEIAKVNDTLLQVGVLGGYELDKAYDTYKQSMLLCVTEKRTKQQIDQLAHVLEEMNDERV
ncbi:aminomethyl-transferring glycine dehydrogenase subunit GcvPA [Vallitalea pronyensis]|uniref:Probable glycine dehydrogenase (decarboxylating) subunit 1 n=1 Tax=Vallitalea pronyensis TaxID=1348613 RepID=A0A8J8MKG7_9FIRM|nr:aminomethyl-transferring glycine dehydrogenase subunit GcvPA [Vallitalea pronyensis]QUI23131.1 aminomethyl-transferring glycine dehydrogenase subunit GcvPA [Vallitalea pronyensis]